MIKVDFSYVLNNLQVNFDKYREKVKQIHELIVNKTGEGGEFLGWADYEKTYDRNEVKRIKEKAKEFREKYNTLVVCGIGGSYLGSNAVIDAINGLYSDDKMEIVYLGNTLDPNHVHQVLEHLKTRDFGVCCISKSGTTTETSISFRILKNMLEEKLGKEKAKDAIVCVTDKKRGALKTLADKEGYETYVLPDDIGGRYSVITPVGLFPIACAGIDIDEFLSGYFNARRKFSSPVLEENDAYQYALQRFFLYTRVGFRVELLASYEPRLKMIAEWWKQLFDESEGKDHKGLLTTSCCFTTDLHSMGQFIQQGNPILFETIIRAEKPNYDVTIPTDEENLDGLNFVAGKTLSYVNQKACEGTLEAHAVVGEKPNIQIILDKITPYSIGELLAFFMTACAMSAYLISVNPFNQPGVEVYKLNMFHLLGKPGY